MFGGLIKSFYLYTIIININTMYQISKNIRKYSPTPIVEIITDERGNTSEKIVLISPLPKKEGNELSAKIVELLNKS